MHAFSMITDVLFLSVILFKVTELVFQVHEKISILFNLLLSFSAQTSQGTVLKWTAFVSLYSLRDFFFSDTVLCDEHFKKLCFFKIPSILLEGHVIKMQCPSLAFTQKAKRALL